MVMGELTINTVVFIVLLHFNTVMSCECLTDSLCIFPGCVWVWALLICLIITSSLQIKKRSCVSAVPAYSGLNMEVDFSLKRLKRKLPYFVSIYRVQGSWSNFPQGLSPGRNANDNKLSLASGRCGTVILTTYSHVYVHRYGFQRRQHKTKHAYTHIWN